MNRIIETLKFIVAIALSVVLLKQIYYIEFALVDKSRKAKHDCEWELPRSERCRMVYIPAKESPKITYLPR